MKKYFSCYVVDMRNKVSTETANEKSKMLHNRKESLRDGARKALYSFHELHTY